MLDQKIIKKFSNVLKKEGMKMTSQRLIILEEIVKNDSHRESEEIYHAINRHSSNVSRATVYRTLDILVKNKFVRKLNLGDGRARYESKIDDHHHDHMISNKCSRIIEFVDSEIEDLQDKVALEYNFILESHIHQLFGICSKCQNK